MFNTDIQCIRGALTNTNVTVFRLLIDKCMVSEPFAEPVLLVTRSMVYIHFGHFSHQEDPAVLRTNSKIFNTRVEILYAHVRSDRGTHGRVDEYILDASVCGVVWVRVQEALVVRRDARHPGAVVQRGHHYGCMRYRGGC